MASGESRMQYAGYRDYRAEYDAAKLVRGVHFRLAGSARAGIAGGSRSGRRSARIRGGGTRARLRILIIRLEVAEIGNDLPALLRGHRVGVCGHPDTAVADIAVDIAVGQILAHTGHQVRGLMQEQVHDRAVARAGRPVAWRAIGQEELLAVLEILDG